MNKMAVILKSIGGIVIGFGCLAFLVIGSNIDNAAIIIGGIVGSVVSGISFIGFGEVVNLLQQNIDVQNQIIIKLSENHPNIAEQNHTPSSVLQDIEANLPKM